jgi:hypothetical protein
MYQMIEYFFGKSRLIPAILSYLQELKAENAALDASNVPTSGGADTTETESPNWNSGSESDDRGASSSHHTSLNRSRSMNRQRLVAHSTAMESIQAESDPIDEVENLP